jgi:hypothetical protein
MRELEADLTSGLSPRSDVCPQQNCIASGAVESAGQVQISDYPISIYIETPGVVSVIRVLDDIVYKVTKVSKTRYGKC